MVNEKLKMEMQGQLEGFPVLIIFNFDGFDFFDVRVQNKIKIFDWSDLNSLQQEEISTQLRQVLSGSFNL
jgi:hypothetical protein